MIRDYVELVLEAAERSGLPDIVDKAPMYVGLAERMLSRRLRLAGMEKHARVETGRSGKGDLPYDYQEARTLRDAERMLVRQPVHAYLEGAKGYTVVGRSVWTRAKESFLHLNYYASVPSAADAEDGTTWLLTQEPELYLQAVLFQVYAAHNEIEKSRITGAYLDALIAAANAADHSVRHAGTHVRIAGATP